MSSACSLVLHGAEVLRLAITMSFVFFLILAIMNATTERFKKAARELHAKLALSRITDVFVSGAWLTLILAPPVSYSFRSRTARIFGDSPAASMILLLCAGSAALVPPFLRLLATCKVSSAVRVDRMANAPRVGRQVAYVSEESALAWWFWLGYVLAPLAYFLACLLAAVWYFIFDLSGALLLIVAALSIASASAIIRCTKWLYLEGVQRNYNMNMALYDKHRKELALYKTLETRNQFFGSEHV